MGFSLSSNGVPFRILGKSKLTHHLVLGNVLKTNILERATFYKYVVNDEKHE